MILHTQRIVDAGWEGWEIAADATHRWLIIPMLFNTRLVCVPHDTPLMYDHGWCYHTAVDAVCAAGLFDPRIHNEPLGWHKRATTPARVAPGAGECTWVDYNLPRCIHGSWLKSGRCTRAEVCPEFLADR